MVYFSYFTGISEGNLTSKYTASESEEKNNCLQLPKDLKGTEAMQL